MILVLLKSFGIWILFVVIAILNGGLREKILAPWLGIKIALPLSGITFSVLIFIITYFLIPSLGKNNSVTYIIIGLLWVFLTLAFEFIFGFFGQGKSLKEILEVFNILEGNLFALILIISAIAPWLTAKLRGLI